MPDDPIIPPPPDPPQPTPPPPWPPANSPPVLLRRPTPAIGTSRYDWGPKFIETVGRY